MKTPEGEEAKGVQRVALPFMRRRTVSPMLGVATRRRDSRSMIQEHFLLDVVHESKHHARNKIPKHAQRTQLNILSQSLSFSLIFLFLYIMDKK